MYCLRGAKASRVLSFALLKVGKNSVFSALVLGFPCLSQSLSEVNTLEGEVALGWSKVYFDLLNVECGVELLALLDDLALEGGHQVAEASVVDDGALCDEVAGSICGEVEDALHFHVVERGVMGDQFAEALEVDVIASREPSDLHGLPTVLAEGNLPRKEDVLKCFACHSTLCSWAK